MGGSAIAVSRIWKKLEHMQANEAFSFKNYTFFSYLTKNLTKLSTNETN